MINLIPVKKIFTTEHTEYTEGNRVNLFLTRSHAPRGNAYGAGKLTCGMGSHAEHGNQR